MRFEGRSINSGLILPFLFLQICPIIIHDKFCVFVGEKYNFLHHSLRKIKSFILSEMKFEKIGVLKKKKDYRQ
jgi:hypothetical protein